MASECGSGMNRSTRLCECVMQLVTELCGSSSRWVDGVPPLLAKHRKPGPIWGSFFDGVGGTWRVAGRLRLFVPVGVFGGMDTAVGHEARAARPGVLEMDDGCKFPDEFSARSSNAPSRM